MYQISTKLFYANKSSLDGFVFWRIKDENTIEVKIAYKHAIPLVHKLLNQ